MPALDTAGLARHGARQAFGGGHGILHSVYAPTLQNSWSGTDMLLPRTVPDEAGWVTGATGAGGVGGGGGSSEDQKGDGGVGAANRLIDFSELACSCLSLPAASTLYVRGEFVLGSMVMPIAVGFHQANGGDHGQAGSRAKSMPAADTVW